MARNSWACPQRRRSGPPDAGDARPASTHLRAMAAGSSPKVVDWSMSPCLRRTQWPSLRSMAGMSSMMGSGGKGRGDSARTGERSGVPVQKVAVQGQAVFRALLGVKLRGKNIIARNGGGESAAVVGLARTVACFAGGRRSCARNKSSCCRARRPHRVHRTTCGGTWRTWFQPICGTLKRLPSGCMRPARSNLSTSPGIRPSPGVSPSALWSSSICMPTHTPNSGLVARLPAPTPAGPTRAARACSRAWRPARAAPRAGQRAPLRGGVTTTSSPCLGRPPARPATPSAGCPCRSPPPPRFLLLYS
jgi:hypothetical protein